MSDPTAKPNAATVDTQPSVAKQRRWGAPRFSLWQLMLALVLLGWLAAPIPQQRQEAMRQRAAISRLCPLRHLAWWRDWSPWWWPKRFGGLAVEVDGLLLAYVQLGDEGLAPLAELTSLRELDMRGLPLRDDDLRYVAELAQLETLHLEDMPLTDRALQYLYALPRLKQLTIEYTDVHREAVEALRRERPEVDVLLVE